MQLSIKLAIRNVHRNRKASLLNGLGITLAVLVILFILSLSRGIESQIVSRNIRLETGAVAISIPRKMASGENKQQGDSLMNKIILTLNNHPEISHYDFRIYPKNTLLYLADQTQSIQLKGIDRKEQSLLDEQLKIIAGDTHLSKPGRHLLLSNGLADYYHLSIGDNCNIMLESIDGTTNLEDFTISGIFRYTSQADKLNVYLDYTEAQKLYNCHLPSEILISLTHLEQADIVKNDLQTQLDTAGTNVADDRKIEISSYKDHLGMARSLSSINRYGMLSLASFLVLISFIGIWSMQVENIHTRKKEIGTLLSFGFQGKTIKRIFIYEQLYISLLSFTLGVCCLLSLVIFIQIHNGLYLGDAASFAFGSAIINPVLTPSDVGIGLLLVLSYPLLGTFIPLTTINKTDIIQLLNS